MAMSEEDISCRYCLTSTKEHILHYFFLDRRDKYEKMVEETFNIQIGSSANKYLCLECQRDIKNSSEIKQRFIEMHESLIELSGPNLTQQLLLVGKESPVIDVDDGEWGFEDIETNDLVSQDRGSKDIVAKDPENIYASINDKYLLLDDGVRDIGAEDIVIIDDDTNDGDIEDPGTKDSGVGDTGTKDSETGDAGMTESEVEDNGTKNCRIGNLGTKVSGIGVAGTKDSEIGDPGMTDSGAGDTGTKDSGIGETGTKDPRVGDTGTKDSGIGDAGTKDPGVGDTETKDSEIGDPGMTDSGVGDTGTNDSEIGDADMTGSEVGDILTKNSGIGNAGVKGCETINAEKNVFGVRDGGKESSMTRDCMNDSNIEDVGANDGFEDDGGIRACESNSKQGGAKLTNIISKEAYVRVERINDEFLRKLDISKLIPDDKNGEEEHTTIPEKYAYIISKEPLKITCKLVNFESQAKRNLISETNSDVTIKKRKLDKDNDIHIKDTKISNIEPSKLDKLLRSFYSTFYKFQMIRKAIKEYAGDDVLAKFSKMTDTLIDSEKQKVTSNKNYADIQKSVPINLDKQISASFDVDTDKHEKVFVGNESDVTEVASDGFESDTEIIVNELNGQKMALVSNHSNVEIITHETHVAKVPVVNKSVVQKIESDRKKMNETIRNENYKEATRRKKEQLKTKLNLRQLKKKLIKDRITNTKWTLRYQTPNPETIELMPNSRVYINVNYLKKHEEQSSGIRLFAFALFKGIYNDEALRICTVSGSNRGRHARQGSKPGLDWHALMVLTQYVEKYRKQRGWPSIRKKILLNNLRKRLCELRTAKYAAVETVAKSSQMTDDLIESDKQDTISRECDYDNDAISDKNNKDKQGTVCDRNESDGNKSDIQDIVSVAAQSVIQETVSDGNETKQETVRNENDRKVSRTKTKHLKTTLLLGQQKIKQTQQIIDTKWTLRHQKPNSETIELMPNSCVYISRSYIMKHEQQSSNIRQFSRALFEGIYNDVALLNCTMRGSNCGRKLLSDYKQGPRPGLDMHAMNVLTLFVEKYRKIRGWPSISNQYLYNNLRNRLYEIRNQKHVGNDSFTKSSDSTDTVIESDKQITTSRENDSNKDTRFDGNQSDGKDLDVQDLLPVAHESVIQKKISDRNETKQETVRNENDTKGLKRKNKQLKTKLILGQLNKTQTKQQIIDTKWTLRYKIANPETIELMTNSRVYINKYYLKEHEKQSSSIRKFARAVFEGIFNDVALRNCTLTGSNCGRKLLSDSKQGPRPGLDLHAMNILILFLQKYRHIRGWPPISKQELMITFRNRLFEIRTRK